MRVLLTAAVIAVLSGCAILAGTGDVAKTLAVRMAVQGIVAQHIEDHDAATREEYAARWEAAIVRGRALVDGQVTTTVAALERAMRKTIRWDELSALEYVALNDIVTLLRLELEQRVGAGELDGEARLAIDNLFEWVHSGVKIGLFRPQGCPPDAVCT